MKMVVLIADDEKMARYNIKSMLNELEISSVQIIEADNGEDF